MIFHSLFYVFSRLSEVFFDMGTFYSNNWSELYHYGVKGQKWGVRRYQNEDGTLTPEGKQRYSKSLSKLIKEQIGDHTPEYDDLRDALIERAYKGGRYYNNRIKKVNDDYYAECADIDKMRSPAEIGRDECLKILEKLRTKADATKGLGYFKAQHEAFKARDDYMKARDAIVKGSPDDTSDARWKLYSEALDRHHERLASAVLKQLGFEDNKENRNMLGPEKLRIITYDD